MADRKILVQLDMAVASSIGNPDAGFLAVCPKSDGLYIRTSAGVEKRLATADEVGGGSSFTISVISGNTNAVNNYCYVMTASLTLTLPASPSVGDSVMVKNSSGVLTCVVARNGSNIESLAENCTIDKLNIPLTFTYVDATRGWQIF
jgi:hypothetical protein